MKLEPVFFVKENKLYKIADNLLVNVESLKKIEILWSTIELEDELYNEECLASLRDELKTLENQNIFAIIVPVIDKPLNNNEDFELFVNACNHIARRIKDCVSVAGFEIPGEIDDIQTFIDVLSKKHEQYVYFSKNKDVADASIVVY